MKKIIVILGLMLGLGAAQSNLQDAHAAPGAAGFPDVVDGDKLRFGNMIVELFGIRAPRPGMICRAGSVEFQCGAAASQALNRIIENYAVKCRQVSDTQLFPMLTECQIGRSDLNRLILRAGWAMVDMASCDSHPSCATYLNDQKFAQTNRKGIWMGTPPSELVALASKPAPQDVSDDDAQDIENTDPQQPDDQQDPFDGPFGINLAAEMKNAQKPDMTLLSLLEKTF
ncbi:thermonuclease family protein [Thalassospira sp. MA62]|nr:thermonuclease family protein [Thalassospira sp. MA62]